MGSAYREMNTPLYPRSLVLCGMTALCVLDLAGSALAAPPQMLVIPFDMFDTSADQRPKEEAAF